MVMPREEHAAWNHNMKVGNMSIENAEKFRHLGSTLKKIEVRGRLLSFGAEYFVFQFGIQVYKDEDT